MAKRNFNVEKSIPGLNFILLFPLRKSVSIKPSIKKEFDEICEKLGKSRSEILRKFIFDFFKVKNETELLSLNKAIRKHHTKLLGVIQDEMGMDESEFSAELTLRILNFISLHKPKNEE